MIHPEILTPLQMEVLRRVAPAATAENFYLGGGTAIALHLGHRRSVDFDWFSPAPFQPLALAGTLRTHALTCECDRRRQVRSTPSSPAFC